MAKRHRKRKDPALPDSVTILPTQFRHQHDIIERAKASRGASASDEPPSRVLTQTMLDRYLQRGTIRQVNHDAGTRLYGEWRSSGCQPKIVGSYGVRIEGLGDLTERQADMRTRVTAALVEVGDVCSRVLVHVCLCDLSAQDWARGRGMTSYVAKTYGIWLLKDALESLEEHYRTRGRKNRA